MSPHYRLYDKNTDTLIFSKTVGLKEFWSIYESEPHLQSTLDKEIINDIYENDIAWLAERYQKNIVFTLDQNEMKYSYRNVNSAYVNWTNKGTATIPDRRWITVYTNTHQTKESSIQTYDEPAILSK